MFTGEEHQSIDRRYFRILEREEDIIVLKSINTGHCWHLYKPYNDRSDVIIFHRHENQTEYHRHDSVASLKEALQQIMSHDQFQIEVRWARKYRTS